LGYQIQLSLSGSELLIYNSIAKLFHLLLLYGILIFFARREQNDIPLRYQAVPLILCQAASTYTCYQLFFSLIDGQNSTADTIGALCLLYVNIVICVYAQKLKQTYYLRSQAQLAQEKLQAQQAYYQDAIQRQEETRALWHDIKKYLLVMESLAHSGEHTKLHTAYEEIRGKYTYLESAVDVGHPVVNAILAYAVRQAHSAEINLTMDVWVSPALELSPADLYVIIGNTVDNAVEACKSLPKEARKLHLTLRQTNHILFYEITNPYSPHADDKPGPIHGYGLKNVEKCVKDHRGEMSIAQETGQFTVSVRLTV
jgi:sensor histidine kinase regulating citrate/malate metabolism